MTQTNTRSDRLLLEEEIWGFRLYEEPAMITLLEFLFATCRGGLLNSSSDWQHMPEITGPSHLLLRTLIFNNPMLEISNDWDDWEEFFQDKVISKSPLLKDWTSKELKSTFKSFENFRNVINLIQASTVNDGKKNRKWTNRFLFPWDQEQVFPDVKEVKHDDSNLTLARNFFGHTGEIAYLLLRLADNKEDLQKLIDLRFKGCRHTMAKVCKCLEGNWASKAIIQASGAYLPKDCIDDKKTKLRANRLCDDLISLLELNLTTEDMVDPMSRIIGIHLACYQIERAQHLAIDPRLKGNNRPFFLCEAMQKQSSAIRRESKASWQHNGKLCRQVLLETFKTRFTRVESISQEEKFWACLEEFIPGAKTFRTESHEEEIQRGNFSNLKSEIQEALEKKFDRHSGIFHKTITVSIGLTTSQNTNSFRYAPSDEFLFALALANVRDKHMPFRDFLDLLYEKYGLVFDEKCEEKARPRLKPGQECSVARIETKDLQDNADRLLNQMMSLGLLRHLSDGCDYVTNPYFKVKSEKNVR